MTKIDFKRYRGPKKGQKTLSFYLLSKKSLSKTPKMFCFGFSSFYVVRVRFSLYCERKYDFFQVFCFQLDLRSLFFGFEGFILRNLRSNSMKNSAIEKKFATRVRKKSDLNKEKGKFLTSKNFKIWQGQNLKISIHI